MDARVRLNVSVPPALRKAAKVRAAELGVTLEEIVETALRAHVGGEAK